MEKELAASSLAMFTFIFHHSDVTGRMWYSELPMTESFCEDCRILIDLGLIQIRSVQQLTSYIRLTDKGKSLAKQLSS